MMMSLCDDEYDSKLTLMTLFLTVKQVSLNDVMNDMMSYVILCYVTLYVTRFNT